MIVLYQSSSNTVVTTFAENTSYTSSINYLWKLTNSDTLDNVYFIASDISGTKLRYNKFSIELTDSGSDVPISGSIYLKPNGGWTYLVQEQTSSTNLNPLLSGAVVERGLVNVIGDTTPTITNYSSSANDNNIVYYTN